MSIDKNAVDLLIYPFPLFRSAGSSPWLWQVLQRSLIAIMMAVYLLTSAGCRGDSSASTKQTRSAQEAPAAREVKVVQAAQMPLERATVALGSLAAYDQATIGVKVPGRLRSIAVDFGSVVQQGALIAQIDPQDYQLRMQQAEASLAQARAKLGLSPAGGNDLIEPERTSLVRQGKALLEEAKANRDRMATLYEQGIVARSQLDSADASYKVALSRHEDAVEEVRNRQALLAQRRSELALARQQLADTTIYAPFDGAVQEKRASVGEYLGAGAPVATIVRMNPLRLRAEVPEREASSVRVGQTVRLTTEGDPHVHLGRIAPRSAFDSPSSPP